MKYLKVVKGSPTAHDYNQLYTSPLKSPELAEALSSSSSHIADARGLLQAWQGIFLTGVAYFSAIVGSKTELDTENTTDYSGSVPEQDITQQSGVSAPMPLDDGEDITMLHGGAIEEDDDETKDVEPEPKSPQFADDSDDDLTSAPQSQSEGTIPSIAVSPGSRRGSIAPLTNILDMGKRNGSISHLDVPFFQRKQLSLQEKNDVVTQISQILRLWFAELWASSKKDKTVYLALIFGLPGTSSPVTESNLRELLENAKLFIENALNDGDCAFGTALKELILLIHEILHVIYQAVAIERDNQNSNRFVIIKSLLHSFYKVDLAQTVDTLLTSTVKVIRKESGENESTGETKNGEATVEIQTDFRLSYGTLMHIYVMINSLCNSPLNLLLVDKVSLSLDITNLENASENVYSNSLVQKDFSDPNVIAQFEGRVIPLLAAIFNYYYGLHEDILSVTLNHTSFFSWITGHKLSPNLYVGFDTVETLTNLTTNSKLDVQDPFMHEVESNEVIKRRESGEKPDSELALQSPTYLNISLLLYLLIKDGSFVDYLTKIQDDKIPLLDIWLCVSSYIHHYQYKSTFNQLGARVSLLTLLKLTSAKSASISALRDHKINEFKWKLCHQRGPVIPISDDDGEKGLLMYILDLVQVTLRFNLTKKLDFDNCKIALTILYQVLLEGEKKPFEDLQSYKWDALYATLIHFIKFVAKNCNEEGLKYVIEEVFSIFNLALGPTYDHIIERSDDYWLEGSHVVRSINFDLFYEFLHHYLTLRTMFDKYIIRKDNFSRVEACFNSLAEKFNLLDPHELDFDKVTEKLNELSLLSDENQAPTKLELSKFNYAETFKYLDAYRDYIDFEKQIEIVDIFNLLYDNTWVL